jgi:hypothetical protein
MEMRTAQEEMEECKQTILCVMQPLLELPNVYATEITCVMYLHSWIFAYIEKLSQRKKSRHGGDM